jgi:hypothetical protein
MRDEWDESAEDESGSGKKRAAAALGALALLAIAVVMVARFGDDLYYIAGDGVDLVRSWWPPPAARGSTGRSGEKRLAETSGPEAPVPLAGAWDRHAADKGGLAFGGISARGVERTGGLSAGSPRGDFLATLLGAGDGFAGTSAGGGFPGAPGIGSGGGAGGGFGGPGGGRGGPNGWSGGGLAPGSGAPGSTPYGPPRASDDTPVLIIQDLALDVPAGGGGDPAPAGNSSSGGPSSQGFDFPLSPLGGSGGTPGGGGPSGDGGSGGPTINMFAPLNDLPGTPPDFSQDPANGPSNGGPVPVPEPAAALLLASGLAGLAGIARKYGRRRRPPESP